VAARILGLTGRSLSKFAAVALGAAVVGTISLPEPASNAGSAASGDGSVSLGRSSYYFGIAGDATTVLTPGSVAALNLTLTNTGDVDLMIVKLQVEVVGIDAPRADNHLPCSIADFAVRQLNPTDVVYRLPARSKRSLKSLALPPAAWPAIIMVNRPANQDGCQGAELRLHYTGSAVPTAKSPAPIATVR
jgi:hypothetical protein